MPLFRRRSALPEPVVFTVGVDNHRVVVGGAELGCQMLPELDAYVGAVSTRAKPRSDGRDPVAVQNAKMDYAEMAEALISVVSVAVQDLTEQGLIAADEVPSKPHLPRLDQAMPTYDYIQETYTRATERIEWVRSIDGLLRERGIAIIEPLRQLT